MSDEPNVVRLTADDVKRLREIGDRLAELLDRIERGEATPDRPWWFSEYGKTETRTS